jgi:antitoxin ChpS
MHTTNLRKVGGSVMLAVPPALLNVLQLQPGAKVGIAVEKGRLVVEPRQRPRYSLDELLAQNEPPNKNENGSIASPSGASSSDGTQNGTSGKPNNEARRNLAR